MGRGVYLIKNKDDLDDYLQVTGAAYIQEYLAIDRDIRVVIIGEKVVHSYWRIASEGEFRSNVALGGNISFNHIPAKAIDLALYTAKKCKWNDVGIDICKYKNDYFILEANMKYGKEGFRKAGIDYKKLMENMIDNEEI
jgi:ribosomal protein S6--L-glutamate ligase